MQGNEYPSTFETIEGEDPPLPLSVEVCQGSEEGEEESFWKPSASDEWSELVSRTRTPPNEVNTFRQDQIQLFTYPDGRCTEERSYE
mmetsp:Transcript_18196/g.45052  ORF Transcript_18196/g.45052 Transcript_18196/m.45052 type:complete len:87 (+) Transcript_18196:1130-1390(+)